MENYTVSEMAVELSFLNPGVSFATEIWSDNIILTSSNDIEDLRLPIGFYLLSGCELTNKKPGYDNYVSYLLLTEDDL